MLFSPGSLLANSNLVERVSQSFGNGGLANHTWTSHLGHPTLGDNLVHHQFTEMWVFKVIIQMAQRLKIRRCTGKTFKCCCSTILVQLLISRFKESKSFKCSYIPGLYFVYTEWNILLLNNSVWDFGQISHLRHNLSIGGWLLRVSQDCYLMTHQTRRWSELIAFPLRIWRDGEGCPYLIEGTENMFQSV